MDEFHKIPLPQTEFQNDMKDANRSPIEIWLEHFRLQNSSKGIVKLPSNEIYTQFCFWINNNNMKYEVNSVQFLDSG